MLVLFALPLALSIPAMAEPSHTIGPLDYFTLDTVFEVAPSPNGQHVVATVGRWDEDLDRRNNDLWLLDTNGGRPARLTFEAEGEHDPSWSPDGQWIYYLSSSDRGQPVPRDGSTQVFRLHLSTGQTAAVTRILEGVEQYQLSADGGSLYFRTSRDFALEDTFASLRTEHDGLEYGHGIQQVSRVHVLDLETWRTRVLVDQESVIYDFDVAPDESRIAMLTQPDEELIFREGWSDVDIWAAATEQTTRLPSDLWRTQAPSPYGWLEQLAWSDDSRALAFQVYFDGYPGETFVAEFDDTGHKSTITVPRNDRYHVNWGGVRWRPQSRDLCLLGAERTYQRVFCTDGLRDGRAGAPRSLTPGQVHVENFGFNGKGNRLVLTMTTPHSFAEVVSTDTKATGRYETISQFNVHAQDWQLPDVRVYTWTAPDGTEVEGVLELPFGYSKEQGPLPTLVSIHGGPSQMEPATRRFWIYGRTLYAAQGWAVFIPNYRGSTGFGDQFQRDLVGHENDVEVQDILSGVDALVADGVADPERLAVAGWSNGGFLTNCIITTTDRFQAASSGAGLFDQSMQWGIEDTPGHVINFVTGHPWENPDQTQASSPLFRAQHITTATIVHVGENDERNPAAHSRSLYRALYHYLDVPVELVVYTGAGHGLTTYEHRKAKLLWDLAWFDHYVLGKEPGVE